MSVGANIQTLKSANIVRVSPGKSYNLYGARENLGEVLMCPAGAQNLQNDIYGRPATQNTLTVNLDASCAQGTLFPSYRQIQRENMERPYIPIAAAGLRQAGDFLSSRDLIPQDLYGTGMGRGAFVRHYNSPNNASPDFEVNPKPQFYSERLWAPFDYSNSADLSVFAGK